MPIDFSGVSDEQIIEAYANPKYEKNARKIATGVGHVPIKRVLRVLKERNIEDIIHEPINRNGINKGGKGYRIPEDTLRLIQSRSFYDRYEGNPYSATKSFNYKPSALLIRNEWINMGYEVRRRNKLKK